MGIMERIFKFKKRIYLVNREFQLRYARAAVLVAFASSLLTLFTVLWPLYQFRIIRFPDFLPTPFLVAIGIAAIANFILIAGAGILLTHRVAGPIFNIVRHLNRMEEGSPLMQIRVRAEDDLQFLVRNLNAFIAATKSRDELSQNRLAALTAKLKDQDIEGAYNLVTIWQKELGRVTND